MNIMEICFVLNKNIVIDETEIVVAEPIQVVKVHWFYVAFLGNNGNQEVDAIHPKVQPNVT